MLYDLSKTKVVNSRYFKRQNVVWRRRDNNGVVFSTKEKIDLDNIKVSKRNDKIEQFSSAKIFISILSNVDHLDDFQNVAWSLKDTVEEKIIVRLKNDLTIPSTEIAKIIIDTLQKFDKPSYIRYASYHQEIISSRKLANAL